MIDSRAVVSPQAEVAADVEVGPFSIIGPEVIIGAGTWVGPHVVINGPTRIGAREQDLPVRFDRRRSAGQEVQGRADPARDRRPERDPGIRDRQPRHRAGRRRDPHRRRQSSDGLFARGARLPRRQPDRPVERGDARRPRRDRRLGDHRRVVGGASIHPRGRLLLHCQQRRGDPGRAALRHGGGPAGRTAQRERRRDEAARLHGRADPECPTCLSRAVPFRA